MPKEMMVGKMTDQEQAEMNKLAAQYQQIQMNRSIVDNQFVQHGVAIKARTDIIVKAHKLDANAIYRYQPNGEIIKIIPDPPPIADNHVELVSEQEKN